MMLNKILLEITTSEVDKKTIAIFIVIVVILFFLFAAIGTAIKTAMRFQAKRADSFMFNVYDAGIVSNQAEYRAFGRKKNVRTFFRQSLLPFLFVVLGFLVWVIASWITNNWEMTMFSDSKDLLFIWDLGNPDYYVKVFGITLMSEFPPLINSPHIVVDHIPSYFEAILILIGIIWYLVVCQSFISRAIKLQLDSRTLFTHSVQDLKKAKEEATQKGEAPPPPPVD